MMSQKDFASVLGVNLWELQILRVEIEESFPIQTMTRGTNAQLLFNPEWLEIFRMQKEGSPFACKLA
jgi:hypothetical protein